jgi:hypothetical protein
MTNQYSFSMTTIINAFLSFTMVVAWIAVMTLKNDHTN